MLQGAYIYSDGWPFDIHKDVYVATDFHQAGNVRRCHRRCVDIVRARGGASAFKFRVSIRRRGVG